MSELNQIYTVGYQSFKKLDKLVELTHDKDANLIDIRFRYNNSEPIKLYRPKEGIEKVKGFAEKRPVILLCACWSLLECHRLVAADILEKELGVSVEHIQAVPKEALPVPEKAATPPRYHQLGIW